MNRNRPRNSWTQAGSCESSDGHVKETDHPPVAAAGKCEDHTPKVRLALEQVSNILIIRVRSLGDSILAIPLVEALHGWRPDLRIDVLVEAPYGALFSRHPAVHETLVVRPRSRYAQDGWSRGRTCLEIRRRRYAAVLNLHGGSTSWLFTLASGAGLRIGQQKYRHAWAYHALIPNPADVWQRLDLHTVEDQLTLMRWLGLPIPEPPRGRLYLEEDARERMRRRLQSAGLEGRPYILIHPTATLRTKQWHEKNFAALADRLHERYSLPVLFSSAPHEAQVLLDIGAHAGKGHRYWSDLGLDDLLALIDGCRLFIGNDSGPSHAAAALGRPLVVVWGSSDFRVWHPWGTEYRAARLSMPCMPCPGYECKAFGAPKCIETIPVEMVLEGCVDFLSNGENQTASG
jgi:ADP-heptose:LPS heptosyltransferase